MKFWTAVLCFLPIIMYGFLPEPAHAQFENVEVDAREIHWPTITRLALARGEFPPAYRPITEAEILHLLGQNEAQGHSISGKTKLRFSSRMIGGYSELGNPVPFEGGLSFATGHNIFLEPKVELVAGSFWSALGFRMGGRVAEGGTNFTGPDGRSDPLSWPNWPIPTGRSEVRDARLKGGAWSGQITRALVGLQLGNWALSAGWDQRRTGPGLTGDLNSDYQGRPMPAVTVRRTHPFQWGGLFTHLSPDNMLLRVGILSPRTISWNTDAGQISKEATPVFFQWLVGWNVTPWFRTNFTHSVMAAAREGTLWGDLLKINFPNKGTTWDEMHNGPVTDRLFAVQFEFRWRHAPWPLLPSNSGRLFWDYGGTDFLPSGPGGNIPQISAPASLVGCELFNPMWDLGFEYAELQHTTVLWYSNSGFPEGYSHEHWLMAHPLGGSGESWMALVRVRPPGWAFQAELQGKRASWGMPGYTPGTGERNSLGLTLSHRPLGIAKTKINFTTPPAWEITAEWNLEKADPLGFLDNAPADSEVSRHWWRLIFKVGI